MLKKNAILLSLPLILACGASYAADQYQFDKSHTHIIFFIDHLGFSKTIGRVKDYDGHFAFDEQSPEKSSIDVTLKPGSIDTSVPALNKEIYSEKFFNVEKYPDVHFKSTKILVTGKNTGDVTGNLTMLGVTKPVVLHVIYNKSGVHPFTNNYVSGFSADADIKRSDFGMTQFIPKVGDNVHIHIEVEGTDPAKHPGNPKTPG